MSVNLRYPSITGSTEKEQLTQIKSYLHQLVEQLNYALPTAGGSASTQSYQVQGAEVSYYELRSLIIQEIQQLDKLFAQLSQKMQSEYVSDEELPQAIEAALTQAKESGEFDGFDPVIEITDIVGGHRVTITDAKGTQTMDVMDGFTPQDVSEAARQAAGMILFTMDDDGNLYYEVEE